jgi:D-glucuronyl C5-epimerase-like protein
LAAVVLGAVLALCGSPAGALAARVVVLGAGGHAAVRDDPFLTVPDVTPAPAASVGALVAQARPRARAASRTVRGELARIRRAHAIPASAYRHYLGSFNAALGALRHLRGTRASELDSVIQNLGAMAAAGSLASSRLPVLFATLDRNRTWWTTGPLLSSGQRVEFAGSEIVWEYYAGQGIELQELGSFGKADGLYTGGRSDYPRFRELLAELIPLAANRAGGLAWEYYFRFDGGVPPWTSAMSQGTAIDALTRAYQAFGSSSYLKLARRALPVFTRSPPSGVAVKTSRGARYLLYSFAPGAAVINGFLQSLIGLYDYAHVSGDSRAQRLFAAGDAEARAEVPRYDTGAWSLYEPGQEDTLDYHTLVTGFLHGLCSRTHASVYCTTATHFDDYLKTPPSLQLLTSSVRRGRPTAIHFRLSKLSHVGIVVVRNGQTVFLTSAEFGYGVHSFAIPALGHVGGYTIRLAATDLASNFNRIIGTVQSSR